VNEVYQKHKSDLHEKPKSKRLESINMTPEELLRSQQELFEKARSKLTRSQENTAASVGAVPTALPSAPLIAAPALLQPRLLPTITSSSLAVSSTPSNLGSSFPAAPPPTPNSVPPSPPPTPLSQSRS